jgi:hypothetical protein
MDVRVFISGSSAPAQGALRYAMRMQPHCDSAALCLSVLFLLDGKFLTTFSKSLTLQSPLVDVGIHAVSGKP